MHHHHHPHEKGRRIILGLLTVLAGTLLLGFNFNIIDNQFKHIIFSWPMLFLAAGFANLFANRTRFFGIVLLTAGALFMAPKLVPLPDNFVHHFWPVILIAAGIGIILSWNTKKQPAYRKDIPENEYMPMSEKNIEPDDSMEELNIFSGSRKILHGDFKGGRIICIFGGSELDLRDCKIPHGQHQLETVCVFGGVKLLVPSDWNIRIEMVSVLGGFADARNHVSSSSESCLHIKGVAIFGGGEIKNA